MKLGTHSSPGMIAGGLKANSKKQVLQDLAALAARDRASTNGRSSTRCCSANGSVRPASATVWPFRMAVFAGPVD
jgi:hypothetical protein